MTAPRTKYPQALGTGSLWAEPGGKAGRKEEADYDPLYLSSRLQTVTCACMHPLTHLPALKALITWLMHAGTDSHPAHFSHAYQMPSFSASEGVSG